MVKTYYKTTWYSRKQIRYFWMRIDYSHSSMKWVLYSTFSLIPVQLISGHHADFQLCPVLRLLPMCAVLIEFNVSASFPFCTSSDCSFEIMPSWRMGNIYWWWRSSYGVSLIADTVAVELPWYFSFSSMKWMECRRRFVKLKMSFLSSYRSIE